MSTDSREPAWRLIRPDGVLAWAKDGYAEVAELGWVLDHRLVDSAPPLTAKFRPGAEVGDFVPIELAVPPCPPVPLGRPGVGGSKLVFVRAEHPVSMQFLERTVRDPRRAEAGLFLAAVVSGADAAQVELLGRKLRVDFPLFPDPGGAIARRAGVGFWPSTMLLDDLGRLAQFEPEIDRLAGRT